MNEGNVRLLFVLYAFVTWPIEPAPAAVDNCSDVEASCSPLQEKVTTWCSVLAHERVHSTGQNFTPEIC